MPETKLAAQPAAQLPATISPEREAFELVQREAKAYASSELVPKEFRNNIANCVIALNAARQCNANPLAVMQNLYIVHGKPSWSSSFIVAAINSCGRFSALNYRLEGEGKTLSCVAFATEKETGNVLESPKVTMAMAEAEGWISKNGSKWKTMPELMIRYRAATFFGRLYAPEILMGMHTVDEVEDIAPRGLRTAEKVDLDAGFATTAPTESETMEAEVVEQ